MVAERPMHPAGAQGQAEPEMMRSVPRPPVGGVGEETRMPYSSRERAWFLVLAVAGFAGLNGVFLWAVVARAELVLSALQNPVAAAFVVEAFVLVGVLAYLLNRWRVSQVHWGWFVLLALVGGIVFALPVVLLWSGQRTQRTQAGGVAR